jgi:RHH-type transcriptional regulator, rel operon repressor / antitoxin RelB
MKSSTLTIRVANTQKKRLEALARSTGRSRSYLAADAIGAYLDVNEWQVAGIKSAIASIDEDGGVDHFEVKKWVTALGNEETVPRVSRARKS